MYQALRTHELTSPSQLYHCRVMGKEGGSGGCHRLLPTSHPQAGLGCSFPQRLGVIGHSQ